LDLIDLVIVRSSGSDSVREKGRRIAEREKRKLNVLGNILAEGDRCPGATLSFEKFNLEPTRRVERFEPAPAIEPLELLIRGVK
jgi:hypothetical protein